MTSADEEQLHLFLDGLLEGDELVAFNHRLLSDREMAKRLVLAAADEARLRAWAGSSLVVLSEDDQNEEGSALGADPITRRAASLPLQPSRQRFVRRSRLVGVLSLGLAASVAIMISLSVLLVNKRPAILPAPVQAAIIEVDDVTGELAWTGADGAVQRSLIKGQRVSAGMFETESEGANADLRFADGTHLRIGSGALVSVADEGQKSVHLRAGTVSADVRPQTQGKPLVLRTPTATLEVLGTVFSVTASADQTTMNVEHGRVRVQRLADGKTVDVPANFAVVASLEAEVPLIAKLNSASPADWRTDFAKPPPPGSCGEWHPAETGQGGFLHAIPVNVGRKSNGPPLIQYGVCIRDKRQPNAGSFVAVEPTSRLRLRYRMEKPDALVLFFVTQRSGGAFGGNFELTLPPGAGTLQADGWRSVEVPLSRFNPLQPQRAAHPAGNGISQFSVRTYKNEADLKVAEFAIDLTP